MFSPVFAELLARSCFSFLRGASQPEEQVMAAKERGLDAIAIVDRMGLYGAVRAHTQARECDTRFITGAELVLDPEELGRVLPRKRRTQSANEARLLALSDAPSVVLLACDHDGYSNLCQLLTQSHADHLKKEGALRLEWLAQHHAGLIAIVPAPRDPDGPDAAPDALLACVRDVFRERAFLAVHRHLDTFDRARLLRVQEQSERFALPVIASARPSFHHRSRKPLADVLCCIREGITLDRAGTALDANSEAFLRSELEMQKLFREHLSWVERTAEVASACRFSLAELRYHFPCELAPGETADQKLRRLTEEGIQRRYPNGIPAAVRAQIEKELVLIAQLSVAPYFLSTWEVVEIARARKILCQGRGSAANSAVCYVLGITAVDPARSNLLFERFMSAERSEPPDIDIDFEHERREEVIQELYARHGRDRAAMVSEVICYRGKSALRETGKAFGLSLEQVDRLSNTITHWDSAEVSDARLVEMGFDPTDTRLRQSVTLARTLEGFPRHLSIHVGGFVLSARPLHEVAPVEPARMPDRTVIPWDKDDIEALGFFKIDVLGLGMLTAIRKCLELIHRDGCLHAPAHSEATGIEIETAHSARICRSPILPAFRESPDTTALRETLSPPERVERAIWGGPAARRSEATSTDEGGQLSSTLHVSATVGRREWFRFQPLDARACRFMERDLSRESLDVAQGFESIVRRLTAANDVEVSGDRQEQASEEFDPLEVITRIPAEDPLVYDTACRADTVGVFQIESRAQMSMLPRLRPRNFYDLVVEVAIVRPGPIQGGMVHPYLRRRNGEEKITSPHPDLWPILERTLGVPLFQEQVMQISIVGAGYTGGEADQLRRDMAAWKKSGKLLRHKSRLLEGFAKKGISAEFGEALFEQIKGFGDYGFPESHASSFALLVYASTWQKAHFPAHFACALINSQPMGFYSPSTILQDAQRHGVVVRDVDVSKSQWDCTLEAGALRIGFRLVKGFPEKAARRVEAARSEGAFTSLDDLARRARLHKDELEMLGEAGALEPLVKGRRNALWQARAPRVGGLFENTDVAEPRVELPALHAAEQLLLDYGRKGLSVGDHPMRHLRHALRERGVLDAKQLSNAAQGLRVEVAGLVICRQQPGTASGVVFITLEDEMGFMNLVLWNRVYERLRLVARHSTLLLARGVIDRQSEAVSDPIVHVIVDDLERLDVPGKKLQSHSRDFH